MDIRSLSNEELEARIAADAASDDLVQSVALSIIPLLNGLPISQALQALKQAKNFLLFYHFVNSQNDRLQQAIQYSSELNTRRLSKVT